MPIIDLFPTYIIILQEKYAYGTKQNVNIIYAEKN